MMPLNRYLIISIVTHMLFISILAVRFPGFIPTEEVFNINIMGPIETEKPVEKRSFIPPPQTKRSVPTLKRRTPIPKDIKPDTMHEQAAKSPDVSEKPARSSAPAESPAVDLETTEALTDEPGIFTNKPADTLPPYFLFDQKTIEKFASKGPAVEGEQGLTFNAPEFRHRGYMRLLKEKIESVWKYPKEAARLGLSGDLYIKFSISRNGNLDKIELIRTSGYSNLDEAVIKALKKAEPYWALPDDWEGDTLEITGHFIYLFGSTYIM